MNIDSLSTLVSVVLAVSLGGERLVTMLKTAFPWLAEEKKTDAKEVDLTADRPRRLLVIATAFVTSWIAASFLADGSQSWMWNLIYGRVRIGGVAGSPAMEMPVFLLGLLASGGSAFWNNVLGFTKAAKDTKQVVKAATTLDYHARAESLGVTARDSGQVANAGRDLKAVRGGAEAAARAVEIVQQFGEREQPAFGTPRQRGPQGGRK